MPKREIKRSGQPPLILDPSVRARQIGDGCHRGGNSEQRVCRLPQRQLDGRIRPRQSALRKNKTGCATWPLSLDMDKFAELEVRRTVLVASIPTSPQTASVLRAATAAMFFGVSRRVLNIGWLDCAGKVGDPGCEGVSMEVGECVDAKPGVDEGKVGGGGANCWTTGSPRAMLRFGFLCSTATTVAPVLPSCTESADSDASYSMRQRRGSKEQLSSTQPTRPDLQHEDQ